jgi:hypothetical protein
VAAAHGALDGVGDGRRLGLEVLPAAVGVGGGGVPEVAVGRLAERVLAALAPLRQIRGQEVGRGQEPRDVSASVPRRAASWSRAGARSNHPVMPGACVMAIAATIRAIAQPSAAMARAYSSG